MNDDRRGDATQIQRLIDAFGDPDPAVREQAEQKLLEMGPAARRPLLDASKSGDPRIAPAAGDLLLRLPWTTPQDPAKVRELLSGYGAQEEEDRRRTVLQLFRVKGADAAIVRLLQEDPSDNVPWTILRLLRLDADRAVCERLRQLPVGDETKQVPRPQTLAAAGFAWLQKDWNRGLALLRRAVDGLKGVGAGDDANIGFAFDLLVADALEHHQVDQTAELRRLQIVNAPPDNESETTSPVLELFALHADNGPAAGFDDDLVNYKSALGKPEVIYALARLQQRAGDNLLALSLRRLAVSASLLLPEEHVRVGQFLHERSWPDDAEREFAAAVACGQALEAAHKAAYDTTAQYFLGQIAVDRGDDAAAAQHFQAAQEALDRSGGGALAAQGANQYDFRGQVIARHLRLARAAHDQPAAEAHLKQLQDLLRGPAAPDADVVIEVNSYLGEQKRDHEAQQIFERAYARERSRLGDDVQPPERLNNLAWLCARCDQRAAEAVELSARAVAAAPENAGYWDTAAEAVFKAGDAKTATMYERRALSLKPGDRFIEQQLKRFSAAAQSG